jgi:hypothetical protein
MVEVEPIEIVCPNKNHPNHQLHEMLDKIELKQIVGWNTTVTRDKLIKGFQIECFIKDNVTDAIIDRSIVYSIKKSEVLCIFSIELII